MLLDLLLKALPYFFLLKLTLFPVKFPELTLNRVFSTNHSLPANAREEDIAILLVTGDILPGRSVHLHFVNHKDPKFAFTEVASQLREADVTLVNLEGPLITDCPVIRSGVTFCGDPRFAEGLEFAGVDVVNIANNHILNFGYKGREETVRVLREKGFGISGDEQIAYRKVGDIKFAFLGLDTVFSFLDRSYLSRLLKKAKRNADVVIVQFHWGQEYTYTPKPAGDDPVDLARFAIDKGADLVVGNHPHWFQGMEFYKDVPIAYSHGNFVFDQMWSRGTQEGVVGRYTFYKDELVDIEFLPVKIDAPFKPRFLNGAEEQDIMRKLRQASEQVGLSR